MRVVTLHNVFITNTGIGLKRLRLINETIHHYPGKRRHFWLYALFQFFFRKRIKLKGRYFLIHNHWCPGYYHWMTEAIPRLWHVRDLVVDRVLILPQNFQGVLTESLEAIYSGNIFWLPHRTNAIVTDLLIPENPPFSGVYDIKLLVALRSRYTEWLHRVSPQHVTSRRVYVSRAKARQRKVINEQEITSMLAKKGFSIVSFEDCDFKEQVVLMRDLEILLGIHGAGLTNMLFMRPGSVVVELQKNPELDEPSVLYRDLAEALGLSYNVIFCDAGGEGNIYSADIIVDKEKLSSFTF